MFDRVADAVRGLAGRREPDRDRRGQLSLPCGVFLGLAVLAGLHTTAKKGQGMTNHERNGLANPPDEGDDVKLEAIGTSADDADIAAEHDNPTFADEMSGGPEERLEDDSPEGLAGPD